VGHLIGLQVDTSGGAVDVLREVRNRLQNGSHLLSFAAIDVVNDVECSAGDVAPQVVVVIPVSFDVLNGSASGTTDCDWFKLIQLPLHPSAGVVKEYQVQCYCVSSRLCFLRTPLLLTMLPSLCPLLLTIQIPNQFGRRVRHKLLLTLCEVWWKP
jgi:hypothetical protein